MARGTCLPPGVSEKKVLNASPSFPGVLSDGIIPSGYNRVEFGFHLETNVSRLKNGEKPKERKTHLDSMFQAVKLPAAVS